MKKVLRLMFWVILSVVIYKAGLWLYESYKEASRTPAQQQVMDVDKECRITADTGGCICRHRRTGERLKLPHSECKERALNPR